MSIYKPQEDSLFLEKFLKNYISKLKNKKVLYLDMGTGSGILSETALKSGIKKQNIIATDRDNESISFVRKNLNIKTIKSNLFEKIPKTKKFDLITFNAPYLPVDKREPKSSQIATTGGKKGDEISIEFIKQAKEHLVEKGKIFLLISSLTPQDKIKKFNPKIVAKKKLFFEEMIILEFNKN